MWELRPSGAGYERRGPGLKNLTNDFQSMRINVPDAIVNAFDFWVEHFGASELDVWQFDLSGKIILALNWLSFESPRPGAGHDAQVSEPAGPYPGSRICGWSEFFDATGEFLAGIEWHDARPVITEIDLTKWRDDKLYWLSDRSEVDRGRDMCFPWNCAREALRDFAESERIARGAKAKKPIQSDKTEEPLLKSLELTCPREGCGGKISERKSHKGERYFGCNKFEENKCPISFWNPPLLSGGPEGGTSCPKCRGPLLFVVSSSGNRIACYSKACGYVAAATGQERHA